MSIIAAALAALATSDVRVGADAMYFATRVIAAALSELGGNA